MGVVYKAKDTSLDRTVALKFLAPHLVANEDVRRRFTREAKTAAALQHPNICTVFEIAEAGGRTFIAMAYLEGHELADEIANGAIPAERAVELVMQFADGLAEAHSKGVVHRDVKPANLFVTSAGRGVILDFGLAQLASADSKLTREGTTLGTCAYMSPEQATGAELDARTDVWAMGCVLYEMLAGRQPFQGHYEQAIIYSILNEKPDSLRVEDPKLEKIVARCLAKAANDRYTDAGELLTDLKSLRSSHEQRAPAIDEGPADIQGIAVLPFENRSRDADDEYFSDGVSEDIISALAKIEGLRVTPRTSAFYFKGREAGIEEIADKLHVGSILTGTVRRSGKRLRITAELIRVKDETQMWSERYDRVLEDVFDIQDEISEAIAGALQAKLTPATEQVQPRWTPDVDAYRLYLQGRHEILAMTESSVRRSIQTFEKALEIEPEYAAGRAASGAACATLGIMGFEPPGEQMEKARADALQAIEIEETISMAHITLGAVQLWRDWDWIAAERSFRRAIELDPSDAMAYGTLSELLDMSGRSPEGLEVARAGMRLDPLSAFANRTVGLALSYCRDFDAAIEQSRRTLEIAPDYVAAMWDISFAQCLAGRAAEGPQVWDEAPPQAREHPLSLASLGVCYALACEEDDARETIARLEKLRKDRYCPAILICWVYAHLGDLDRAFELAETALNEREGLILTIKHYPGWAGAVAFRKDPRFESLIRRIGFPD